MESLNATLLPLVQKANAFLADYILIFLLVGAGLWFTIKTGFVQRYLSQGRTDTGIIEEGCKADLIVIDIDQPNMHPIHNMATNLVYSASGSDIVLTMADGKVLYQDGEYKTIDIERTIFEVEKETAAILKKL